MHLNVYIDTYEKGRSVKIGNAINQISAMLFLLDHPAEFLKSREFKFLWRSCSLNFLGWYKVARSGFNLKFETLFSQSDRKLLIYA